MKGSYGVTSSYTQLLFRVKASFLIDMDYSIVYWFIVHQTISILLCHVILVVRCTNFNEKLINLIGPSQIPYNVLSSRNDQTTTIHWESQPLTAHLSSESSRAKFVQNSSATNIHNSLCINNIKSTVKAFCAYLIFTAGNIIFPNFSFDPFNGIKDPFLATDQNVNLSLFIVQ